MTITVNQVNAFTADGKHGNPAGVVIDEIGLTEDQMLSVAKAVGFSETAFISSSAVATRQVRFFTSTEEVDLCGHATIASWSFMHQQGIIGSGDYTQETGAGVLQVQVSNDGLVYMEQAQAQFFDKVTTAEVAPILGLMETDFHPSLLPQVASTGLRDLLVPVATPGKLASLKPDFSAMIEISKKYDVTGLHVFSLLGNGQSVAAARNFAPLVGITEESATGTSNGALLCYLRDNNVLKAQDEHRIEQGRAMQQLSYIFGMFNGKTVWIGGHATAIKQILVDNI